MTFNSIADFQQWLKGSLKKMSTTDKLLLEIGSSMHAITRRRIWTQGLKSDGTQTITSYSTKPLYVSVRASSKIRPLGKQGKSTFKNGRKKKSRYVGGGYKELKSIVGRTNPLELTGQFLGAYSFGKEPDSVVLGFRDIKRKTFASGLRKDAKVTNRILRIALEKKYGIFTQLTDKENKQVQDFITKHISSSFK